MPEALDIIVTRCIDSPQRPTAGSTVTVCSICGAGSWIAKTSRDMAEDYDGEVIYTCVYCATGAEKFLADMEEHGIPLPTSAQIREIVEELFHSKRLEQGRRRHASLN